MQHNKVRLVVCGSGLVDNGEDKPWNQTDVVNSLGTPLWEHRKVAAYAMREETLGNLQIKGADGVKALFDDISWSEEIIVGDIDGLGRCIVLICQDLMMEVVGGLLEKYEPDWVFVPILDSGTNFKRWPFARVVDLSARNSARFVIVSSLTMQHWRKEHFPGEQIGVAVGPRYIPKEGRALDQPCVALEINCETSERRHGTFIWRSEEWQTVKAATAVSPSKA